MSTEKPNILLILADDIGWFDVGAYHRGLMGTRTPNIDRLASEGAMMTDAYARASCTEGRAAFITGQIPTRTGLTTVGLPGAKQGLQPEDPTLAELLKPEGYLTAQHGKNHLGDLNEFLRPGVPALRRREAVDGVAGSCPHPAARDNVPGLPATTATAGLQPTGDARTGVACGGSPVTNECRRS